MKTRRAEVHRVTSETDIAATLTLDGAGAAEVSTGIGFLDHMLELFAHHSGFDLVVAANGDLDVDGHHTVEDTALTLGQALKEGRSATSAASAATAPFCCPWTRRWPWSCSISPGALTSSTISS